MVGINSQITIHRTKSPAKKFYRRLTNIGHFNPRVNPFSVPI